MKEVIIHYQVVKYDIKLDEDEKPKKNNMIECPECNFKFNK